MIARQRVHRPIGGVRGGFAVALGIELDALPDPRSAVEQFRLAAALKRITSVSNRWLVERLQMGATTTVGSLLHQFRQGGAADNGAFKAVLSRFSI